MLRQMAREAAQCFGDGQPLLDTRYLRVETELGEAFRQLLALIPPSQRGGQGIDLGNAETKRPARIAQSPFGPVGDQGCGQCRPLTAVLGIDVLDNLLASFMLEIDIDIRRFATLF